ncbi:MAG: methylated-DNA--[protein]-cysteine S-methyltransferase [Bacteroidaceae bacterium]
MSHSAHILHVQHYLSPCGEILLASLHGKLCLCDWYAMPSATRHLRRILNFHKAHIQEEPTEILRQTKQELDEYFAGKRHTFDIPLLMTGTDFQKQVWHALLRIPYGETRSYMEIARQTGCPQGVRAVAQAIGANGLSIIIPCHRVIGADHSLTGYAGGLSAKRILLQTEGISLTRASYI